MNVVLACTVTPFSAVGEPWFFHPLAVMLESAGHTVETLQFPYTGTAPDILDHRLALRLTDVAPRSDALIAIGAPACCLRHPNKVVWLDSPPQTTPVASRSENEALRTAALADAQSLREARRVFAASRVLAERWCASAGRLPDVLYPSVPVDGTQPEGEEPPAFLVPAGPQYRTALLRQTAESARETVRFVDAGASSQGLGLLYFPADEACYSAVFAQAVASGTCVITADDAGAAAEFVRQDPDGIVVPPEPAVIAAAIGTVVRDRKSARLRAEAARERMRVLAAGTAEVLLS